MIRFTDFIDILTEASWFTKGKKQVLDAQIMKILRKSSVETRSPEDKARLDRTLAVMGRLSGLGSLRQKPLQKASREAERAARKKGK